MNGHDRMVDITFAGQELVELLPGNLLFEGVELPVNVRQGIRVIFFNRQLIENFRLLQPGPGILPLAEDLEDLSPFLQ